MKTIKLLSLPVVLTLPIFLSGCESLFMEDNQPGRYYASESYYHYYDNNDYNGGNSSSGSRSYGGGGSSSGSSKPRSNRPSTSSTADSIESAEVPVEPPSI